MNRSLPLVIALGGFVVAVGIVVFAVLGGSTPTLEVNADKLAFDTDELELPANESIVIAFENEDSEPHNIAIYENARDGRRFRFPLFDGTDVEAGNSIEYELTAPPAGEYYFQCDIHPTMSGKVIAR